MSRVLLVLYITGPVEPGSIRETWTGCLSDPVFFIFAIESTN